jgi:GR25 family glycosyltransferase involved in LPS biosynthesis
MKKLFLLFFVFCAILDASIVDHLKKADGKSDNSSMRNIDFIYMINLDKRPEKFKECSVQLNKYGIYPYRFSAVNGWKLSIDDINDVGLKYQPNMTPLMATVFVDEKTCSHEFMTQFGKTYFAHCLSRGAIGCYLSHVSILKDALESGYETIWVMEDDVEILQDPNVISDLIDKLDQLVGKDNWDVLFTDQDYRVANGYLKASGARKRPDMDCSFEERYSEKYTTNQQISPDFKKVSARFATHSMIIRRSGIEKLFNFAKEHQIFLPYDLENYLIPDIKRFSFTFDVVTNKLNAISDNGVNH